MGRMKYGTPEKGDVVEQPATINQPPQTDPQPQIQGQPDEDEEKKATQGS